jgi:hypothetical protein
MSSLEIKEFIHKQIDGLKDERFLEAIYSMLNSYIKDEDKIVGYTSSGEPITLQRLKNDVLEAEKRIDAGEYTTQKELKKESKGW